MTQITTRAFDVQRHEAELPIFMRVLEAIPEDQLGYRPHERSPLAEQVVSLLAGELRAGLDAVIQYRSEWTMLPVPPMNEMLKNFSNWSHELIDRVAKMADAS
jgi:hypothetical protein